jgi:hypothetical protein
MHYLPSCMQWAIYKFHSVTRSQTITGLRLGQTDCLFIQREVAVDYFLISFLGT